MMMLASSRWMVLPSSCTMRRVDVVAVKQRPDELSLLGGRVESGLEEGRFVVRARLPYAADGG